MLNGFNQPQDLTSGGTPSQSTVNKDLKAENGVNGKLESYCKTDESDEKPYFQLSFDNKYKVIDILALHRVPLIMIMTC